MTDETLKARHARQARPGSRNAYMCDHKDHDMPQRVFVHPDEPTPRCGKHGVMKRQTNVPYFGRSTS